MFSGLVLKCTSFVWIPRRLAGHSKWANIKHTKAAKDGERSQLFVKICQRIKVAIQEGGSADPSKNLHLAQAVEIAKKSQMPVASIQSCIKSSQADKSKTQGVWYEVKGPRGCFVIVSTLTDNPKKTRDSIASILRRNRVAFSDGSLRHLFEHKAVITAKPPEGLANAEEATVDHAIECGAEEVAPSELQDTQFDFVCSLDQINHVKAKLLKMNYEIINADFEFIPSTRVTLTDEDMDQVSKLFEKLETLPEVIKIYDNIL